MIGKVKKWLGIEGVKLEIVLDEDALKTPGVIRGTLRFQSMNQQTVTRIQVVLIERYERGRGEEKRIDEYELGRVGLAENFDVPADEIIMRSFELPYTQLKSEMDEFADKNFLFRGISKAAKRFSSVKSTFRLEAEANVRGVALNPFDKREIKWK